MLHQAQTSASAADPECIAYAQRAGCRADAATCVSTFAKQQEDAISRYTDDLVKKVVATIGEALADLQPADLSFGQGLAGFGVNRRRVRLRNLPGPVDHDVPVLSVRQPGG